MEKVFLLKYGELHLKGKNRGYFERLLKNNLKERLSSFGAKVEIIAGRFLVSGVREEDEEQVATIIAQTAGLHSLAKATKIETSLRDIASVAKAEAQNLSGTFKVVTKRADKAFRLSSMQLSSMIGEEILKSNKNLSVDVHTPEHIINIDIREDGNTYIYGKDIKAIGGMPVGSSGKGLLLLSGGIDSPVAGYLMAKRGMKLTYVHFESFPYTSPLAKEKTIELAHVVSKFNGKANMYVFNIAKIQEAIHEHCHPDYMITLVRRFMLRLAARLASEKDYNAIVTGESLAQVASQTVESMSVIGEVLPSSLPLLKPLVAFDKEETVVLSKKIGAFEISIRPYDDCCTVFLPESPIIKPKLERVKREEARLNVDELLEECYNQKQKIEIE